MAYNPYNEIESIVLDNGSGTIKVGFTGDDAPKVVIPNIIGQPRYTSTTTTNTTQKETFIGDKVLEHRDILSVHYPIEHGIVTNWDDMEAIWRYLFHRELHLSSIDFPVLVTEAPRNPLGNREKMAQILFEHFQVPAFYVANEGILSFYYLGRTSGIILESGDGTSYSQIVFEGHAIPHSVNRLDFAGRDLTDYLARLLAERGYSFATTAEQEIVRDMKEKLAYVTLESDIISHSKRKEVSYGLPDGQKILIGDERFQCAEALFQPKLTGIPELGIAEMLYGTVMKADIDIRPDLYCNISLAGGTTLLPGFAERLEKEITALISTSRRVRVVAASERRYAAWIGGSILASLSTFQRMWITKEEYEEHGPTIVHQKCL